MAAPDPSTVRFDGPWIHRDIHANGIRFHVVEVGDAEPDAPLVVLLHGFADFWWSWRHQLTALSEQGFRVVAMDLRGYGDSDKPPRGYDGAEQSGRSLEGKHHAQAPHGAARAFERAGSAHASPPESEVSGLAWVTIISFESIAREV